MRSGPLLILAVGAVCAGVVAYGSSARVDLTKASAPLEMSPDDLGRYYDANLRPLQSKVPTSNARVIQTGETQRELKQVQNDLELKANAQAWGLASASAGINISKQHAYYRAIQIDRVHHLDGVPPGVEAPTDAAYYVSAVYMGRMYEVHFSGTSESVNAAISGTTGVYSGGLDAWASQHHVEFKARTVGLQPRESGNGAIFASSDNEIQEGYTDEGPLRAVKFRLSQVPGRHAQQVTGTWKVTLVGVQYPQLKANRKAWDVFGNAPDPMIQVTGVATWQGRSPRDDTYEVQFDQVLGKGLTINSRTPLFIEAFDRDMSDHDSAGKVTITGPQDGEREDDLIWFTTRDGVRIGLRMEPAD